MATAYIETLLGDFLLYTLDQTPGAISGLGRIDIESDTYKWTQVGDTQVVTHIEFDTYSWSREGLIINVRKRKNLLISVLENVIIHVHKVKVLKRFKISP